MSYTFVPKEPHAKACSRNSRISQKNAIVLCNAIKKKPLNRALRLLNDMVEQKRSLRGKYYSNAALAIKNLIESCEKNADFMGLDKNRLFVHASASHGNIMRRRRRKAKFGSRMKSTNIEIILIERGKATEKTKKEHKKEEHKHDIKDHKHETKEEKPEKSEGKEIQAKKEIKHKVEQK